VTAQKQRSYVFGTPTEEEKRLDTWVHVAGHYIYPHYCKREQQKSDMILACCTDGKATLTVEGSDFALEAGSFFFLPIHQRYDCVSDPSVPFEFWWLRFQGEYAAHLAGIVGFSLEQPTRLFPQWEQSLSYFQRIFRLIDQKPLGFMYQTTGLLLSLLLELKRQASQIPHLDDDLLGLFHYKVESLEELVEQSGYSRFHFIRLFKEATGTTPWNYILQLKIDKARSLLLETELPIKDIAREVGFSTPHYFTRLFRREVGITPSAFRQRG
jgi:AraC-like DNA-binding protein